MEERGKLPPIPRNTLRRLEAALQEDEKGAEAELFTQSYNFFEGPHCSHRAVELEYEEELGDGSVIRRSGIVDELTDVAGKSAVMLMYARTIVIDADGNESLDLESQRLRYEEISGDIRAQVEIPSEIPLAEADYEKINALLWRHVEELRADDA